MPNNLHDPLEHYQWHDDGLRLQALTHRSVDRKDYQRLEFLGDRILGFVVSQMLYASFPQAPEGDLAKRLGRVVSAPVLTAVAKNLQLEKQIRFKGEGTVPDAVLADVVEALIAAMFLDGGMNAAESFIRQIWAPLLAQDLLVPADPKSALQEWAQGRSLGLPEYTLQERRGPDHAPEFVLQVQVMGYPPATGVGATKQLAEKMAASNLLAMLNK